MRGTAVIAYDIANNRRRRAVLRVLREWRIDGQYSAHECRLARGEAHELFLQLGALIDPLSDRLLLAWTDLRNRRGHGAGAHANNLRLFR
ncbi:MAG TPA: CRISPR-associated endonuclease Cas2 [Xanthomonadaceae bacterium]|nr:CRISPR-associated endonuclease Cas2 [Xanthomonadaceae bacterium]